MKETGYPISMDDVNLSSVEVQYYMNENQNEVSSPIIYNKPEQLSELKKGSEMLSDGTVLGKTGTGQLGQPEGCDRRHGNRGGLVYHGEGCSGIYEGRFSAGIVL